MQTETEAQFGQDTTTKPVFAELTEDGKKVEVYFNPSPKLLEAMHKLGAKFQSADKVGPNGTPHWTMDVDFESVRQLVVFCGGQDKVEIGDALFAWGQHQKDVAEAVDVIMNDKAPKLEVLPKRLPALAEALHIGPLGKNMTPAERKKALKEPASFQLTDTKFLSTVDAPLNANHPGLGKTLEAIGAAFEGGTADGPNLVIAPVTSLETVWKDELERWQDYPVFLAAGENLRRKAKRLEVLHEIELMVEMGWPFWLIVNPEMVRLRKISATETLTADNLRPEFPILYDIEWGTIIGDEVHKKGLRDPQSITAKGFQRLKIREGGRRMALSGTPVGGKPINLFGILNWLDPQQFPSRWRWADQWLNKTAVKAKTGRGQQYTIIGDVKEDLEEEFDLHMKPYMIRRTKAEALPWLPPKHHVDLWCPMTEGQKAQYERFTQMAEVELGDATLSATSILAIYMRLKQFASAKCMFDQNGKVVPTNDSGKLKMLEEKLEELGIMGDEETRDDKAQALVFSQFTEMVDMVYNHLKDKGVRVLMLTGEKGSKDTEGKRIKRAEVKRSFQDGEAQVCIMNTLAGGVSITMDNADSVFILDETWNPDDQEQAEDRAHRASRIHQVTCYYLRTSHSIEEYIQKVTDAKGHVSKKILDLRRVRLH